MIGLSAPGGINLKHALILAKAIKQDYPAMKICVRGAAVTSSHNGVPEYIDFMVKGHGGKAIVHLANDIIEKKELNEKLSGIWFNTKEGPVFNGLNNEIADDECLPDYADLDLNHNLNTVKTYAWQKGEKILYSMYRKSFGCPSKCSYCTYRIIEDIIFKNIPKVIAELREISTSHPNVVIKFVDSMFNMKPTHYNELLQEIINQKIKIKWWVLASIKGMTKRLLEKMAEAGCVYVFWGVEHFSHKMLKVYNKLYLNENVNELVVYATKLGMHSEVSLILNGPHENIGDLRIMKKNIFNLSKL